MATGQQGQSDPSNVSRTLPSAEHFRALMLLIGGYRISQAIRVVAALALPDLLADGPKTSDALAAATGMHAGALSRVLRLLAGVGLFDEVGPREFDLTPLGAALRTDMPGSLRSTALMHVDEPRWASWAYLLHSVRTGQTAFEHVHGMGIFTYLEEHPEAAQTFQEAMTSNTTRSGAALTRAYALADVGYLVDVGGGQGLLLATILLAYPAMKGVLFDQPSVVATARATLEAAGVAGRCEIVGGDFFEAVPEGGDVYVLRQILHDWDDARAIRILSNCRTAIGNAAGKVLVIEAMIASNLQEALPALHLDMEMLVTFGGLQRTEEEYRALFSAAGFRLSAVTPLDVLGQFSVFEGTPL